MAKEKVTLTLDAEQLAELRALVGARSLSATVDGAVAAYLAHVRHLAAVDEWLFEMEREDGPIPPETQQWAADVFDAWEAERDAAAKPGTGRRAG
ncbi:MAG: CopG family transcriptional regulator [Sporichthyaceae bacterium]